MRWLAVLGVLLAALVAAVPAAAQDGQRFESIRTMISIDPGGDVQFKEQITVNFGSAEQHGIIRELRTRVQCGEIDEGPDPLHECPGGSDRLYPVTINDVTDGSGQPLPFERSQDGANAVIRIGDPDTTVTGRQAYRIDYTVSGALNAFEGHDELYWNVTGNEWALPIDSVEVRLALPTAEDSFVACYEGVQSTAPCDWTLAGGEAIFRSSRTLFPGEELTIAAGWPKGVVAVQAPILEDRVSVDDFFTLDWIEWGGMAAVALVGFGGLLRTWWLYGRDRRYTSIYYLTDDPDEDIAGLFEKHHIVVEFLPPDDLRPAQMGVIVDERADTLDVTATIIDLAVRGYLRIEELEKKGWFGKPDWKLHELPAPEDDELEPYEQRLLNALFRGRKSVKVSSLRTKFHEDLAKVKDDLYKDAMKRKWFSANPASVRQQWLAGAVALTIIGVALSAGAGYFLERALIQVPLVAVGLLMLIFSRSMARRTATGSEAMRRVHGFRRYITTAETRRQEFNEQQGIFERYLPFAIVFECVDRWAEAFEGLDDEVQKTTSRWYTGHGTFHVAAFAAGLSTFSGNMSSAIQSTPGGSGGSGFSGGSSGGGGGGGGGSTW